VLLEMAEAEAAGVPPPFYSTDGKMADSVMDFLFASQVPSWLAWLRCAAHFSSTE
jgi:hypothetical protein